jgi:starch synthase
MPSYFEPCGLGQLIGLRYGTLPVVRKTGGLADTVIDADEDAVRGNGFSFAERSPEKFLKAVERGIEAFGDKKRFDALRSRALKADFSWAASAKEYETFYERLLKS